ncbi:hypothetical protein BH09BAC5_BH09BAC5_00780 [soil metagenome]
MKHFFLLWICLLVVVSNGLKAQNNTWYTFPSMPDWSHRYIYVDENNTKWLGGYSFGLHKFDNTSWTNYMTSNSGIANNDVRASCFDTLGNLWITTWSNLSCFDTTNNSWTTYNVTSQQYDVLSSVQVDDQNRVWVGTDGGADPDDGLYMFDGTTWTFYNPLNSALTGRFVCELKKDLTGQIWGCAKGLFEINGTNIINHPTPFSPTASATCVAMDSHNYKWVGVYTGGVGRFNGSNWITYTTSNSPLPDDKVWSIAVDQNDVVWIGMETGGLASFDGVNWTIYNTSNSVLVNNWIDALAVDQQNNLWITPFTGGIVVHNPQGLAGISGKVYYDANNNNVLDSLEPVLRNQIVSVDSGAFHAITDNSGNYFCPVLSIGNHVCRTIPNTPYVIGIFPDSISFAVTNSTTNLTNNDFGIKLQSNIHDILVDFTSIVPPRSGFEYPCNFTVKNIGSLISDHISLTLKYDTTLILDSASYAYQLHQGDSIVWSIDTLQLFEQKSFKVYFHVPSTVSVFGPHMIFDASAFDVYSDADSTNNIISLDDRVIGAFDPNCKHVDPEGDAPAGIVVSSTSELTYTIRFQNTGTANAINVIVKDTIDATLDLSTLEIISSSHSYNVKIKNGRQIWFEFDNINLPDSNSNEPSSHGYIKFKLKIVPPVVNGMVIKNTGYIYFDFNEPIITNPAITTINDSVAGVMQLHSESKNVISLFPNPAKDILNIHISAPLGKKYSIEIYDSSGRLMFSEYKEPAEDLQVNISKYARGTYIVHVTGEIINEEKSFIIVK